MARRLLPHERKERFEQPLEDLDVVSDFADPVEGRGPWLSASGILYYHDLHGISLPVVKGYADAGDDKAS